jgi:hypothetical protein
MKTHLTPPQRKLPVTRRSHEAKHNCNLGHENAPVTSRGYGGRVGATAHLHETSCWAGQVTCSSRSLSRHRVFSSAVGLAEEGNSFQATAGLKDHAAPMSRKDLKCWHFYWGNLSNSIRAF